MTKTDIVFYLGVLGLAWQNVADKVKELVSGNVYAWLNVAFLVVAVVAYAFYERLNGNQVPPQLPPQV